MTRCILLLLRHQAAEEVPLSFKFILRILKQTERKQKLDFTF